MSRGTRGKRGTTREEPKPSRRQETFRATSECAQEAQRRAHQCFLSLIDGPVDPQVFVAKARYINLQVYSDVVVERAVGGLCGYAMCRHTLTDTHGARTYVIRANKVYDITERRNFCSNVCYEASEVVRRQVLKLPLYLRDTDDADIKDVCLPDLTKLKGRHGKLVDITGGINDMEMNDAKKSSVTPTFKTIDDIARVSLVNWSEHEAVLKEDQTSDGEMNESNKADQNKIKVEENGEERTKEGRSGVAVPGESPEHVTDHRKEGVGTRGVTVMKEEVSEEDKVAKDGGRDSNTREGSVCEKDSNTREGSVCEKDSNTREGSVCEKDSNTRMKSVFDIDSNTNMEGVCDKDSNTQREGLCDKDSNTQREGLCDKDSNTQREGLCDKELNTKREGVCDKDGQQFDCAEGEKETKKSESRDDTKNKGVVNPLVDVLKVESVMRRWVSFDSLRVVLGDLYLRGMLEHMGHSWDNYDTTSGLRLGVEAKARYIAICRRLEHDERLEEGRDTLDLHPEKQTQPSNPLPDYSRLQREAKNQKLKVVSFLGGNDQYEEAEEKLQTITEEEEERAQPSVKRKLKAEKQSQESDREPTLPFVDSYSQIAWRHNIVTEKVNIYLQQMLERTQLNVHEVRKLLRPLVATFHLAPDNISFQPKQWRLITLILLKMLSVRYPILKHALRAEEGLGMQKAILSAYSLDLEYGDRVLAFLTEIQHVLSKDFKDEKTEAAQSKNTDVPVPEEV